MRVTSVLHSFALASFCILPSIAFSIDSRVAGEINLRSSPDESDKAAANAARIHRRQKKKCSSGLPPGSAVSATGTGYPGLNASTLATVLPYSRTSLSGSLSPSLPPSGSGSAPVASGIANSPLTGSCQTASITTVTETTQVTVFVTASLGQGSVEMGSHHSSLSTTSNSDSSPAPFSTPASSISNTTAPLLGSSSEATTSFLFTATGSSNVLPTLSNTKSASTTVIVDAVSEASSRTQASASQTVVNSIVASTGILPSGMPSGNATNANPALSDQEFWAGACIGTVARAEAIPGRVFYDYDGKTVKDPIKTLGDAGLNAYRVQTARGDCLGPTHFVNGPDTLGNELLFKNSFGCIDTAVKLAQRAHAAGMKRLQLTINQGFNITADMESLTYPEMITNIKTETKRQLQPFLDVGIVPDIILMENEGSDGFLFMEESTGHIRGTADGLAPPSKVDAELCGTHPTGKMNSYPQLAGYYKAEINACNEAIAAAGFATDTVRYGLHSHGQYVQWKEGEVHGPNQRSQSELKDSSGKACAGPNPIPAEILAQNASTMLTIMGFSAYPDPMTPTDIASASSQNATLDRTRATLDQLQSYAEAAGRHTSGPFKGQWKLQGLGVEYATSFKYEDTDREIELTEMMWEVVKGYSAFLGMLWWEPWYCYNDWEGGRATLCRTLPKGKETGEAPTELLRTWGKGARSPWV